MDNLYQETIMNHGHNPLNFGKPKNIGHSIEQFNPLCGDKIILYLINDCLLYTSPSPRDS